MHTGMRKRHKVVLDANWYVSACISRKSRRTLYYEVLKNAQVQVFYAPELMTEFNDVIYRPKFAKIVSHRQVHRFKTIALKFLKQTKTGVVPSVVRDADDNYLLGICESCQANFLVTGDQDLLVLGTYQKTRILNMNQFLQMLSLDK